MALSLSILTLLVSLAVASIGILLISRRTGHGIVVQLSGFGCAALGLLIFFNLYGLLPSRWVRYVQPLAFGTAYLGQASIVLWLSLKRWPKYSV